jgi:hypothetical protein
VKSLGSTTEEYVSCPIAISKMTRAWEMLIRINEIGTRRATSGANANNRRGSRHSRAAAATTAISRVVISKAGVINRPTITTANPERADLGKRI